MSASERPRPVRVPLGRWALLLADLRRGGEDRRESGAFLLGAANGKPRVTHHVCYDALDPAAYQGGAIAFHDVGYAALSDYCGARGLRVLADVHTHPGRDVSQSAIDQRQPMLPLVGHTALIVPRFGRTPWWSLKSVGVYEYLGGFQWRTHPAGSARPIELSLW